MTVLHNVETENDIFSFYDILAHQKWEHPPLRKQDQRSMLPHYAIMKSMTQLSAKKAVSSSNVLHGVDHLFMCFRNCWPYVQSISHSVQLRGQIRHFEYLFSVLENA